MSCATQVSKVDIGVVRGDEFEQNLSFRTGWDDLVAAPGDYQINMVFREAQDDALTPYLTLTATPIANVTADPTDPPVIATVTATPAQTSSLPEWNHVYYTEIIEVGAAGGSRLFQGKVEVED